MSDAWIELDGSAGEGGGQILRSALSLSAITGKPFRISNIRARRKKPGLMRQHLAAVRATAAVCGATLDGAEVRSRELSFVPGELFAGDHHFAVGSAGSACLVLQTVLPPLLLAQGRSKIVLEGGTHNPMAPTFDFLRVAFFPLLRRMGASVDATLIRHGFYPAGGGQVSLVVEGGRPLQSMEWMTATQVTSRRARVVVSNLPEHIPEREVRELKRKLGWLDSEYQIDRVAAHGPGNLISMEIQREEVPEMVTAFGEVGLTSEAVARRAVGSLRRLITSDAPIGEHLCDQLLIPLALAGGGAFRCVRVTPHLETNSQVVEKFLDVKVTIDGGERGEGTVRVA